MEFFIPAMLDLLLWTGLSTGEGVHGSKNVHEAKNAGEPESEGEFQKLLIYALHLRMSGAYEISEWRKVLTVSPLLTATLLIRVHRLFWWEVTGTKVGRNGIKKST